MSLIKWEPFGDIDRFFGDNQFFARLPKIGVDMAVDVYEDGGNVIAEMNVPGMKAENISVEVEDDYLRIAGAREEAQESNEKDYYSKEIRRGQFERVVRLPQSVEEDKVEADYEDGVLKITMPKRADGGKKQVKVKGKKS